MVHALSALDALKNHLLFILSLGRDQYRDRLAQCFFGRVAVEMLGTLVPTSNDAGEIFGEDCIIRRFNDGRKKMRGHVQPLADN